MLKELDQDKSRGREIRGMMGPEVLIVMVFWIQSKSLMLDDR